MGTVHCYQTISDLRSHSSELQISDMCETLGYYSPFDGGGSKYTILSDSVSTEDGGYIIRLNTTKVAKMLIVGNEINALQYGAHPNWTQYPNEPSQATWSTYDNKAIFAKMMAQARDLGCNVYIPAGTYMCCPTQREDTLLPIYSGITLRGDGAKTIITLPTFDEGDDPTKAFYSPLLKSWGSGNIIVKDITLDGNRHLLENGTYFGGDGMLGIWGMEIYSPQNVLLHNVTAQNCMYAGFRIWGNVNQLKIDSCRSLQTDCGFITIGENEVKDITITNCLVDGHSMSEGISIYQRGKGKNIIISNNILRNKENAVGIFIGTQGEVPSTYGLEFWNENVTIEGNQLENFSAGITLMYASHTIIQGNSIYQMSANSISINYSSDILIANNLISRSGYRNINVLESRHIIAANNLLKDNASELTEESIARGFIYVEKGDCISLYNNHIYQSKTAIRKYLRFENSNEVTLINNDVFHEINKELVSNPITRIWIGGTNENDCLKNSYIELPEHTDYYSSYPAKYDNNRNHSNVIIRRKDVLSKYYMCDSSSWEEFTTCCRIDPLCQSIQQLVLMPTNARKILYFTPTRAYDVQLLSGGNIYFSSYNSIKKDERWIIELVCIEDHWIETSRTKLE